MTDTPSLKQNKTKNQNTAVKQQFQEAYFPQIPIHESTEKCLSLLQGCVLLH